MFKLISSIALWCFIHSFFFGVANSSPSLTTNFIGDKKLESVLASQVFIPTGKATFSLLFWDLYKSQLKTTSGSYPISLDQDRLIFHINYLVDISKEDLIKRTIEQWQHQRISTNIYQHYIKLLKDIWPNIYKGDSLAMLMQKNKSVFYFNEHYIGEINDDVFGQLFINIWLDQSTSHPSLRDQLIGGNVDD